MASMVLARAALTGDTGTIRTMTELVLQTVKDHQQWAPLASAAIPRALFATGERDLLSRVDEALGATTDAARYAGAVTLTARGLSALVAGAADDAVALLQETVELERERGAHYNAACAELDVALAYEARGDAAGAAAARSRADAVLGPLGSVNPV